MPIELYHREGPDKDRLTQPGQKLQKDAAELIRPLFMQYCKVGFSAREISHVMRDVIAAIETECVLGITDRSNHQIARKDRF